MEFFKGVADFFVASFPFGLLNVFVLAFVIAIIVERFVFILMKYRVNSREFMAQIRKLVQAGNIDRAIKLCEAAPLPLLQVVKAGLSQVNRGEDAVISAMEERMAEVIPDLEKRIGSLWSLANIATLIGLLGTISGLIRTFQSMDLADKAEQAQKLSEGLAEAMYNTALGLGIAVFCMFFHLILHGWAKRLKLDMERSVMKLENLIASRKQG
jgi:biopolymer transport protein ExbB/TolQ